MAETDDAPQTAEERNNAEILKVLAELGGKAVGDDSLEFKGTKFVLPEQYRGDLTGASKFLKRYDEQQNAPFQFKRVFQYRPFDGAYAFQLTMKEVFGSTGLGAGGGMFGKTPPEMITVDTGPRSTAQVPWGNVELPQMDATFTLTDTGSDNGPLFVVYVSAPRKYQASIQGFFDRVEATLRARSIYKGKAITAGVIPNFLDPYQAADSSRVVYTQEVKTQLNANLWALLEHTGEMRAARLPLKRRVLLEGPYGTGKSLAGALTAQKAIKNGWTYIQVAPQDDLLLALNTAKLYAPAVVQFEDVDTLKGRVDLSTLLEALDGVTSKGSEIIALFTSNHPERIPKGVMRPGRIDSVIHVAELDRDAFEELIRTIIPAHLLGEVDFGRVAAFYEGFLPAFAVEATERALRYSIARNQGKPDVVTTDDLTAAAQGLRRQLALMEDAEEDATKSNLDEAFRQLTEHATAKVINDTQMLDYDDDPDGRLKVNGKR